MLFYRQFLPQVHHVPKENKKVKRQSGSKWWLQQLWKFHLENCSFQVKRNKKCSCLLRKGELQKCNLTLIMGPLRNSVHLSFIKRDFILGNAFNGKFRKNNF